jgi:hypothetical protein
MSQPAAADFVTISFGDPIPVNDTVSISFGEPIRQTNGFKLADTAESSCPLPPLDSQQSDFGSDLASHMLSVSASGVCTGPPDLRTTGKASSTADESQSFISGSASSTVGAVGEASAIYFDIATLLPPSGSTNSSVTVGFGTEYTLTTTGTLPGEATASILIAANGQVPHSIISSSSLNNGTISGLLFAGDITVNNCPCTVPFEIEGEAGTANDASASFSDPVFFNLPAGWTFVLASQQMSVTEPGSLLAFGSGILVLAFLKHAKRQRGRFKGVNT